MLWFQLFAAAKPTVLICTINWAIVPYCLYQTPLPSHFHPSKRKVLLLLQPLSRRTRHLYVTSGFAPSPDSSSFPGCIIPFKLQSYLRPILSPCLPGGYQTIHPADFMSPGPCHKKPLLGYVCWSRVFVPTVHMKGAYTVSVFSCESSCLESLQVCLGYKQRFCIYICTTVIWDKQKGEKLVCKCLPSMSTTFHVCSFRLLRFDWHRKH